LQLKISPFEVKPTTQTQKEIERAAMTATAEFLERESEQLIPDNRTPTEMTSMIPRSLTLGFSNL
jgi:hypothetical protein